jgi:hypothetical protein
MQSTIQGAMRSRMHAQVAELIGCCHPTRPFPLPRSGPSGTSSTPVGRALDHAINRHSVLRESGGLAADIGVLTVQVADKR